MQSRHSPLGSRAFTLLDLIATLTLLAFLLAVLMPSMSSCRRSSRQMQNSTQFRGIHQGMVMYAQGNRSYFPGLTKDGRDDNPGVENRFSIMLNNNYFTGEYAISPVEVKTAWTTGAVSTAHYSYSMLQLPPDGGRRSEWRETLNTHAAVLSDRNTAAAGAPATGVWSGQSYGSNSFGCSNPSLPTTWVGSVLWNDNHVSFESTQFVATTYGPHPSASSAAPVQNPKDDLFHAVSSDDALMVYLGN